MLELSRTEIFNLVNAKRQKEQEILPASRTKPLRNGSPSNIHGHGHYQQSRHSHHHPGCDLQWKSERPNERPPTRTPLQPLYYIEVTSPPKSKEDMLIRQPSVSLILLLQSIYYSQCQQRDYDTVNWQAGIPQFHHHNGTEWYYNLLLYMSLMMIFLISMLASMAVLYKDPLISVSIQMVLSMLIYIIGIDIDAYRFSY